MLRHGWGTLLALLWAAAAAAAPCESPAQCFAGFLAAQREIIAVQARFHQVKEIALLAAPLESRGRFEYARNRGIRWEVEEPAPMVVEIAPEHLRAGPPGHLATIQTGDALHVLEEMAGLFTGQASADSFDLSPGTESGAVTLRPRDPSLARTVEAIEIAFDTRMGTPRWIRIDEVGGDRTRIEMSEVRVEHRNAPGRVP